jgi:hypothetical protein
LTHLHLIWSISAAAATAAYDGASTTHNQWYSLQRAVCEMFAVTVCMWEKENPYRKVAQNMQARLPAPSMGHGSIKMKGKS